jgi:hypothetical protein
MGIMSGDDRFDEFVQRAAADYNRPPEVPREAMWEAIRAERALREGRVTSSAPSDLGARRSALGQGANSEGRGRGWRSMRHWGLAAAAVLLLVGGIAIGRGLPGRETQVTIARDDVPVRPPVDSTQQPPQQQLAATQPEATESQQTPSIVSTPSELATVQQPRAESREPRAISTFDRQLASSPQPSAESRAPSALNGQTPSPHQYALQQHLARSEALLVAFRAGAREGQLDGDLSRWARDLLSSTRLLLDSPAAGDPRRRRMLEDLELVLVQIVQLAPDAPAEDRDDVGRAIEQGDVWTRLRNTAPAGALSSGT